MSMNQQIADLAARDLVESWDGRLPTWEEFKQANRDGRVRANKTIAAKVILLPPIPLAFRILYGVVVIWAGFLIIPGAAVAFLAGKLSAWWILGAVFAAIVLVKIAREGHCEGMKAGAERDERFYEVLASRGAFLFEPASRERERSH